MRDLVKEALEIEAILAHCYDALFHWSGMLTVNIRLNIKDDIIRAYAITPDDSPLSIDNPSNTLENSISVYPNPVVNELNINVSEQVENVTVSIYNVAGQLVINENFTNNNISVNTANLTQGVYIAKININGKISTVKFVK